MLTFEKKIAKNVDKNDVLWLTHNTYLKHYTNKFVKFGLYCIQVGITVLTLVQTYLFLKKFDGRYFIKYAPIYLGQILVCIFFLDKYNIVCYSDCAGYNIYSVINKINLKFTKYLFLGNRKCWT